jgi:transcriptional regulator with XRE-family HTH domain
MPVTTFFVVAALSATTTIGMSNSATSYPKRNIYSTNLSTGISPSDKFSVDARDSSNVSDFSVTMLRDLSGLTANQLGSLFGVSRRSINNWMAGAPMAPHHSARLQKLREVILQLTASTPIERKTELLDSSKGMSLFHQLVSQIPSGAIIQGESVSARNQLAV